MGVPQYPSPSEFGNYVAGYAGAYHGGIVGTYGAMMGGVFFDLVLHGVNSDLDKADVPLILMGALDGYSAAHKKDLGICTLK